MNRRLAEAEVVSSFYRQYASQFISGSFVRRIFGRFIANAGQLSEPRALVVGYAAPVDPFLEHFTSIAVADLSPEMLAMNRSEHKVWPVQCDVRALPFTSAFDFVSMLGSVTAYMVATDDLVACARALHGALKAGGILLIDFYEVSTIHAAGYFCKPAQFAVDDALWIAKPRLGQCQSGAAVYPVTVEYCRISASSASHAFHGFVSSFRQRFYSQDELADTFANVGLAEVSRFHDRRRGRAYLALKKTGA